MPLVKRGMQSGAWKDVVGESRLEVEVLCIALCVRLVRIAEAAAAAAAAAAVWCRQATAGQGRARRGLAGDRARQKGRGQTRAGEGRAKETGSAHLGVGHDCGRAAAMERFARLRRFVLDKAECGVWLGNSRYQGRRSEGGRHGAGNSAGLARGLVARTGRAPGLQGAGLGCVLDSWGAFFLSARRLPRA